MTQFKPLRIRIKDETGIPALVSVIDAETGIHIENIVDVVYRVNTESGSTTATVTFDIPTIDVIADVTETKFVCGNCGAHLKESRE